MEYPLRSTVKYELSDFIEFNYWHIKKLTKGFIFFILLWLFYISVILMAESYFKGILYGLSTLFNQYRWMISLLIIFLLLIGFFYLSIYNVGKRIVKENKIWSEEKEILIDENGVSSVSASSSLKVMWNDILSYGVTKNLIVLYYTKTTAILIPKRFTKDCEFEILEIIKQKNIKRRK